MAMMLNLFSANMQAHLAPREDKVAYMETFKQRMARLRKRAGFKSQQEAAEAIGCERGTVGMWEAPSSAVESVGTYLLATARAYKVRPDYLMTGRGDDGYPWEGENNSPHPFTESSPPSQSGRIDAEILAEAIRSVRIRFGVLGIPVDHEANPEPLARTYDFLNTPEARALHPDDRLVALSDYFRTEPEGDSIEQRVGSDGEGHRTSGKGRGRDR